MYITALDFGSSHIKGVIADVKKDGSLVVLKTIKKESAGIKRGEIVYPEETVKSLFEVLSEARHFDKRCLKNLVCGLSGTKSKFGLSHASVSIPRPDLEIISEDVERVIHESMAINLPAGWQILHSLPREYIIDDIQVDDADVVGLSGKKLEANVIIISIFSSIRKNFEKVLQLVFGKKSDFSGSIIFSPLACDRAVLSKQQRELGVVLVDVGFGTTSVVVYQDGKMLSTRVLPVGAGNITNDIAIGLKCSVDAAERIKVAFGCAFARDVATKDKFNLSEFDEGHDVTISRKYVAEIIEVRAREIFGLVQAELKALGKAGKLPGGAVVTGGGAKMPGVLNVAREELKLPAQVGLPNTDAFEKTNPRLDDELSDPQMAVACGLLLQQTDMLIKRHVGVTPFGGGSRGGWLERGSIIAKFIRTFITLD